MPPGVQRHSNLDRTGLPRERGHGLAEILSGPNWTGGEYQTAPVHSEMHTVDLHNHGFLIS
jgi:hypothetical protein